MGGILSGGLFTNISNKKQCNRVLTVSSNLIDDASCKSRIVASILVVATMYFCAYTIASTVTNTKTSTNSSHLVKNKWPCGNLCNIYHVVIPILPALCLYEIRAILLKEMIMLQSAHVPKFHVATGTLCS